MITRCAFEKSRFTALNYVIAVWKYVGVFVAGADSSTISLPLHSSDTCSDSGNSVMQMSRTETEFLRPRKYDVHIRDSLIALCDMIFGEIIRRALPSENILAPCIWKKFGDSIKPGTHTTFKSLHRLRDIHIFASILNNLIITWELKKNQ